MNSFFQPQRGHPDQLAMFVQMFLDICKQAADNYNQLILCQVLGTCSPFVEL